MLSRFRLFPDIRCVLPTGFPPTRSGISLHWTSPSMRMLVYCSQYDHSAWRVITFTQSGGPPSPPCITPPQHDWRMEPGSFRNGAISLVWLCRKFVYNRPLPPSPVRVGPFYACVRGRDTRVLKDVRRGPRRINSSRKRHGEGSTVDFLCRYSHLQ